MVRQWIKVIDLAPIDKLEVVEADDGELVKNSIVQMDVVEQFLNDLPKEDSR